VLTRFPLSSGTGIGRDRATRPFFSSPRLKAVVSKKGVLMIGSAQHNGNNKEMLDQQSLVSSGNGQNSQMTSTAGNYEGIPPTSIFNLTDRLPIFTYLVNSNRIR